MAQNTLPYYEDQLGNLFVKEKVSRDFFPGEDNFSAEHWRLSLNGTRQFVQYGSITGFTDNPDDYTLEPQNASDTFVFETAEIFRHYPRIPAVPTFNFEVNQSLQSGDKVTLAYGDADLNNGMTNADGWIMEFEPGLGDDEVYLSMYRNGTIVSNGGSKTRVGLERNITDWRELAILFHASVGSGILKETYTNASGFQDNIVQSNIGVQGGRGPERSSRPIQYSVTGGGNGLQLQIGSTSLQSIGERSEKDRDARVREKIRLDNGDTQFYSIGAFRNTDPNLSLSFSGLELLDFSGASDVELELRSFDPSNVTFGTGSWGAPSNLRTEETALEFREDVDQFPDETGTQQTTVDPTSTKPGGFQVGFLPWVQGGSTPPQESNQPIYYKDVVVILARGQTAGNIDLLVTVNESR